MQRRHQKRQRLPLAAGKQADLGGHALFQPKAKARKQLAVILPLRLCHAPAKPALLPAPVCQRQVFFDLHIRRGTHHGILKNAADELRALILRHSGDVLAADEDRAGIHRPNARNGVQQRGFARAVAADDRDEIAVGQFKAQVADGVLFIDGARIEGLCNMFELQHDFLLLPCWLIFFAWEKELLACACKCGTARKIATIMAVKSFRSFGSSRSQRIMTMTA